MSDQRFTGRVAVITGAGGRIGRAIALRLASEGARVLVVDVDRAHAKETVAEIEAAGGVAVPEFADLADPAGRMAVVPVAVDRFGRVDILINNAAYHGRRLPVHGLSEHDWNRVLATNLTAAMVLSRDAADDMVRRGDGAIVNITSLHERLPLVTYAAYATSKGGLLALTRSLATELSVHGIRVNAVQPAVITTPGLDVSLGTSSAAARQATLLGRAGTPEELAAAVAFLASDDASFITGVELPVDGGRGISRLQDPFGDRFNRQAEAGDE